ncbi:DUF3592 domain-containing protein [Streptomyces sp. NPDC008001]|uniref:DUF3592 domain-containing protein n=1 Tax=Streptomyces sp. NPDC008001 TaxID=3364804 RepID=UPI0036E9771C
MRIPGGESIFLCLLASLFGAFAVHYLRRLLTVLRVLRHGERAPGTCVDIRYDRSPGSDTETKHFVFAFREPDGGEVRFEDRGRAFGGLSVGSPVRVSYDPGAPRETATIADRDHWGAVAVPAFVGLVCGLVALVLLLAAALAGGVL